MPSDILTLPPPPDARRLVYGKEPAQFVDFRFPANKQTPALAVMIHGGFWRARYDLLHAGHLCAALTAAGFVTANVEYRRVGDPEGGWPGSYDDILAALRLARREAGAKRTVVVGHSAGGHLALRAAADEPSLKGVVALAPVANLQKAANLHLSNDAVKEFLGGSLEHFADACAMLHGATVPRVLIHGRQDANVPLELSRDYAKARAKDPGAVELIEVDDCDHFDLIDPRSTAWGVVLSRALSLSL
jgi:acetyl esterase/lipase